MSRMLVLIYLICINVHAFGEQTVNIKIDKNHIFQLDIANQKYYLVPIDPAAKNVPDAWLGIQPDKSNPIACDGTLLCYKCCTAHYSVNKEFCEYQYKNWKRGAECGCEE